MEKLIKDLTSVNELLKMLEDRVKCYSENNEMFYKVFGHHNQKQKDLHNCERLKEKLLKSKVRILKELQESIKLELLRL